MPSVENMMGFISELESSYITVHQERCILVRNRNSDCLRCAEVCTSGCISYDGETLSISPEKCIGCGTCATACPTCALEAHHPGDDDLLNQSLAAMQAADGLACLACGQLLDRARGLYDPDKVVRVECLGRVEEALLTTLAAQGAQRIVLVSGDCEACEHKTGRGMAQQVCETERTLLDAWDCPVELRISRKMPGAVRAGEAGYDKDKRAFFSDSGKSVREIGAIAADYAVRDAMGEEPEEKEEGLPMRYLKVMEDGTLPHFVPDRRDRLLDALAQIGDPRGGMISTRLWGRVEIDTEQCASCRMCATFCPTGAIAKFDDEDGSFGVEHYPGDCVKCRCCQVICPEGAITVHDEVNPATMLYGEVERFEMREPAVRRDQPHAIWHVMRTLTKTDQVYER